MLVNVTLFIHAHVHVNLLALLYNFINKTHETTQMYKTRPGRTDWSLLAYATAIDSLFYPTFPHLTIPFFPLTYHSDGQRRGRSGCSGQVCEQDTNINHNHNPYPNLSLTLTFNLNVTQMDNDEAGQDGAGKFANKIGIQRCYIVQTTLRADDADDSSDPHFKQYIGPKDANEALLQVGAITFRFYQDSVFSNHLSLLSITLPSFLSFLTVRCRCNHLSLLSNRYLPMLRNIHSFILLSVLSHLTSNKLFYSIPFLLFSSAPSL
jgi:hypothetical protein